MQLVDVSLTNWRSYSSADFSFPKAKGNKRIILIGAMNGVGKTSFLMALYLGLFGPEGMHHLEIATAPADENEQVRGYRQMMERMLHRPALDRDAPPLARVELHFCDDEDDDFIVEHKWHFTPKGKLKVDDEEIVLTINGRKRKCADWKEASNRISEKLFGAHLMPCFFFDGEQAQRRVEAAGGAATHMAIDALYGTSIVRDMITSLDRYAAKKRTSLSPESDSNETALAQKRTELKFEEEQKANLLLEIKELEEQSDRERSSQKDKFESLQRLTGDDQHTFRDLTGRRADLKNDIERLEGKLEADLVGLALPIALRRLGREAEVQLKAADNRERAKIALEELVKRADTLIAEALPPVGDTALNPPLTGLQRATLEDRLRRVIVGHADARETLQPSHWDVLNAGDRTTALRRLRVVRASSDSNLVQTAIELQQKMQAEKEIARRLAESKHLGPKIEALQEALDEIQQRLGQLAERLGDCRRRLAGHEEKIKELGATVGRMESARKASKPIQDMLTVVDRVRTVAGEVLDELIPIAHEALQERCSHHLQRMISEEFKNFHVEFGRDNTPHLIGRDGTRVEVASLGGAQKRVFGLAFTLAVADVSGCDLPIVIDTPVGNMDGVYRGRVLEYLAVNAPAQLVLLSHDEEIYGRYAKALDPYIAERFLVDQRTRVEGAGISTVHQGKYFPYSR